MGVEFFEFYVCPGIRWAHDASLFILPADLPFLRAIGRYHCQNGNGPIKILNRCYDRSFVVLYGGTGRTTEEVADRIHPFAFDRAIDY